MQRRIFSYLHCEQFTIYLFLLHFKMLFYLELELLNRHQHLHMQVYSKSCMEGTFEFQAANIPTFIIIAVNCSGHKGT